MRNSVTLRKIRGLRSASANRLRCDRSHFNVLSMPPSPSLVGSFLDPGQRHVLLSPEVYLLLLETELLLPTSAGSFGFPCLLVLFLPPFVSRAGFHAPASPTYHVPSPAEPGNLAPAHPACSSFLPQRLQFLTQTVPFPSCPATLFTSPSFH